MNRPFRAPRLWLLAGLLAPLFVGSAQAQQSAPQSMAAPADSPFTAEQRAAIVAIVRQALITDPSILRDAVTALRGDEEQRQVATTRQSLASAQGELTRNPADQVAGNPQGDVTVVVFYDPRCPYCRRMTPTISALLAADHKVRLVYKDLPILGPASMLESRALVAAQKQGGYVKLQEALMRASPDATPDLVRDTAQKLGLDWARLSHDMTDPAVQAQLDANIALAHRLAIEGTPALVVGDQMIPGAIELPELREAVANARKG
jgi:protein-disulfide isomerase